MIFKSDHASGELNGFLDAGSHMQGELRFDNTFRIDGRFNGTIISDGDLVVGDRGDFEGEIRVAQVFISGTVKGEIQAQRKVQIAPGGKVFADLETPSLIIEDGAIFEGRCSMVSKGKSSERVQAGPARISPLPVAPKQ